MGRPEELGVGAGVRPQHSCVLGRAARPARQMLLGMGWLRLREPPSPAQGSLRLI